jgi:tRNA(Ile)-lysidine synthase
MSPVDGVLRRPFLRLRRAETEQICRAYDLEWWTDPHNTDPAFRRSRVRAEVMPLLEDVLGGGVAEALARTADQVRSDSAHLDDIAAKIESPLRIETLQDLAPALRSRVLRRGALEAGADGSALTAAHLAELDRLVTDWHGQVRIELPGGIACVREGDSLSYLRTPVGG